MRTYKAVEKEYRYDPDPFCPDPHDMRRLKQVIEGLDGADRTIIRLYAELGNLRSLGEALGCSKSTALNEVKRIREKIYARYGRETYH